MFNGFTPGRCLVLLFLTSCILFFALVPRYQLIHDDGQNLAAVARQVGGSVPGASPAAGGDSTPATSSTTSTTQTTSPTQTPPSTSSPTTSPTSTLTSTSTSSSATPTTPTNTPPPAEATSQVESTNSDGQVFTQVITVSASSSSSSSNPSPTSNANTSSGSSRLSTGSIIGMSVCGGIAFIGIIAFIGWKITRKRVSDSFDDAEAIKWPELHNDNHSTTAGVFSSEGSLSRGGSMRGYQASVGGASQSQVELYPADPYAVPPLPHLNPNQPPQYRDDPNAVGYYDPYPGPVPTAFHDSPGPSGPRGEAIPMTQIAPGSRARSPGPQQGFAGGRGSPAPVMGRQSPGPYSAMSRSPAPSIGYGAAPVAGRQSPGPQDAYGYGR